MTITRTHTIPPGDGDLRRSLAGLAHGTDNPAASGSPVRISIGGDSAEVPAEVAVSLRDVLALFASGRGVAIGAMDEEVTTGQAASMLGVSRTYVCRLVDDGTIPCRYAGTHRRLKTADVLAYADRRRTARARALEEMVSIGADAGLYDDDF